MADPEPGAEGVDAELVDDLVISAAGPTVGGQQVPIPGPVYFGDIAPRRRELEVFRTVSMDEGHGWPRR